MKPDRRRAAAAVLLGFAAPWTRAAGFPSKPLRIIVPFGAGGIADLTARVVAQRLGVQLGQNVVVENRPGAGGVTAGEVVARAQPDGHTLLLMSNATAVSSSLFRKLPFDAQKDFAPVSLIGLFDLAIIVPESSDLRSIGELIDRARAKPGKLNIGTVNVGSTQNLAAELFRSTAAIEAQVVPFNGTPAVVTALRAGQIDAAVEILGPVRPQIESKALRALAVMGDKRPAGLQDVPTLAESGAAFVGFNVASWNALAAPARTPREIIARLNRELQAALMHPEVGSKLAELHVRPRHSTPEQLAGLLASETRRWAEVIARARIARQ